MIFRRLTLPAFFAVLVLSAQLVRADTFQSVLFDTATAPTQKGLLEGGPNGYCGISYPGTFSWRDGNPSLGHLYQAYTFHNNGPARCASARIYWTGDDCGDLEIGLAFYLGSFDPNDPTKNLVAHSYEDALVSHTGNHQNDYRHSPGYYRDLFQSYFLDSLSVWADVPAESTVVVVLNSRRKTGQPALQCPRSPGAHLYLETTDLAAGPAPALSVNDVSEYEYGPNPADGGTLAFWVTLSAQSDVPVSVHWATQNGTGVAGTDYDAASGDVTFAPGETVKVVNVKIRGNSTVQANRTVKLVLSNPTPAAVALPAAPATGTILDDDNLAGTCHIVSPSNLPFGTVGKPYGPVDMTPDGQGGSGDFAWSLLAGSLPPGIGLGMVTNGVDLQKHGLLSGTPTVAGTYPVTIRLNCPTPDSGTENKDTPFSITILPEASQVAISLDDASIVEGNAGLKSVQPLLHLSAPLAAPQDFLVELVPGSATVVDNDYVPLAANFKITVPAGVTTFPIPLQVVGDTKVEDDEKFLVLVKTPIEGTVVASGQVTIVNDDFAPPTPTDVPALSTEGLAALALALSAAGLWLFRSRRG